MCIEVVPEADYRVKDRDARTKIIERARRPAQAGSQLAAKPSLAVAVKLVCRAADDAVAVGKHLDALADGVGRERRIPDNSFRARGQLGNYLGVLRLDGDAQC